MNHNSNIYLRKKIRLLLLKHAHPDRGGDDANIRSIRQHAQVILLILKNMCAQNLSL